jgi:peptidoglycan/LPS O-acetylase OafA/YrhL
MAITQLNTVKSLPFILSNILAIFTVLPLAFAVLALGRVLPRLFCNYELKYVGMISYEIYLVHAFTLKVITASIFKVIIFVFVTFALALVLHLVIKKVFLYGRFNGNNPHKK